MTPSVKVVIGGAGGVGKTTYLHRFVSDCFTPETALTIGISFITKTVRREGRSLTLQLWDLGGQERFRPLQPAYVRGARAGIVFFDMSIPATIFQIGAWVSMFRKNTTPSIPIILGGTKLDCVFGAELEPVKKMAVESMTELGLACFVPTSAKDGTNVEELMNIVIDQFMK